MLFDTRDRPDDRQLRQFAVALIVIVTLAVAVRWARHGSVATAPLVAAAAGWAFGALGCILPRRIEWLFRAATILTRPVGRIVSEVLLALLYFGVITPIALVSRSVKRDRLRRRIDRAAASYWVPRRTVNDPSRYFRQS